MCAAAGRATKVAPRKSTMLGFFCCQPCWCRLSFLFGWLNGANYVPFCGDNCFQNGLLQCLSRSNFQNDLFSVESRFAGIEIYNWNNFEKKHKLCLVTFYLEVYQAKTSRNYYQWWVFPLEVKKKKKRKNKLMQIDSI